MLFVQASGLPCCAVVCRELELQRSVLSAQLSAQAAAIQQEREALISQRVNTDMLASLSEQVRQ
jgi:multidrug efflux pump subunit AcrA (membrane-fusion protein)